MTLLRFWYYSRIEIWPISSTLDLIPCGGGSSSPFSVALRLRRLRLPRKSRAAPIASEILTGSPRAVPVYDALFDELRLNGFIEGQNLTVDARSFGLRNEQLPETAAAIARSAPDAIVSGGILATRAAQEATKVVPILARRTTWSGRAWCFR